MVQDFELNTGSEYHFLSMPHTILSELMLVASITYIEWEYIDIAQALLPSVFPWELEALECSYIR